MLAVISGKRLNCKIVNPQNNNYDFILNDAKPKGAGFSQKQRIIQVVIAAAVLLIIFVGLYMLLVGNKKSNSEKLLPVYGSLLDIKAINEQGAKDTKNTDLLNQSATNVIIISSQLNELNKYVDKKLANNKKAMAIYRNEDFTKSLADAKQNGTYDKTYSALLANRVDLHKQKIVTAYDAIDNKNIQKMLEEFNSQISTANGAQTMPTQN